MKFDEGEEWKKVYGPVFVYLNSGLQDDNLRPTLWKDAKEKVMFQHFIAQITHINHKQFRINTIK